MNLILKGFSVVALCISAVSTFAAASGPAYLITHNNTSEESNAFIAGTPSPYPTAPNSTKKLYWNLVKLACYGHTEGKSCAAIIKMATNTSTPVVVGEVRMNLDTGDITPKYLSNNGYTFTVNGTAEATITKQ